VSLLRIMTEQTGGDTTPIEVGEATPNVSVKKIERESDKDDVPDEDETKQETALYAATNLESWDTDRPHYYARDVGIDDICFRRLDPDYYAWLRYKMALAKRAVDSGRISSSAFEMLRARFNDIRAWGMEHFGEGTLLSAIQSLDPKTYSPPVLETFGQGVQYPPKQAAPEKTTRAVPQYLFPKEGDWPFTQEVSPSAVAKVNAIRDKAVSLGWSEARLYQNRGCLRFPYGQDYGLVCFVDDNVRVGEVTRQSIEIVGTTSQENRLRFYNPDVDQPWLRRMRREK